MFYLVGVLRISSLEDNISRDPERTYPRRQREEPGYIEVLPQRKLVSSAKVIFDPYVLKKAKVDYLQVCVTNITYFKNLINKHRLNF